MCNQPCVMHLPMLRKESPCFGGLSGWRGRVTARVLLSDRDKKKKLSSRIASLKTKTNNYY